MERQVFNLFGLPKSKSTSYFTAVNYYTTNIASSLTSSPVPIIIDNGSYEFRAVNYVTLIRRAGQFKTSQWLGLEIVLESLNLEKSQAKANT